MKMKTNFLWFSVEVFKEKEIKVLKEQFCQSNNNWAIHYENKFTKLV